MLEYLLYPVSWVYSVVFNRVTLVLVILLLTLAYRYVSRRKNYWKNRGAESAPYRFPFGFVGFEMFSTTWNTLITQMYNNTKKAGGVMFMQDFSGPAVSVSDPEVIKSILVKDFDHFTDRTMKRPETSGGVLSKMLVSLFGQEWKKMRNLSTPAFSTGKIKLMLKLCEEQAVKLAHQMHKESQEAGGEIELKDIFSRYTMDNIATVAFAQETNSIQTKDSIISSMAAKLTARMAPLKMIVVTMYMMLPAIIKKHTFNEKYFINNEATTFFINMIKETIRQREEHPEHRRADFLQILLDARQEQEHQLTDEDIVAQCVLFYIAGFETTSGILTWAGRLLAFHPDIQHHLQDIIDEKLKSEDPITFEILNDMPDLDNVISETLRMFPTTVLTRCCTKPYHLPGSGIELEKNTTVYFCTYGMHTDPEIYPEPEKFDPDRFQPENRSARSPYTYMPFGHGPRNCIGMRFALLQAKLALVAVLRNYNLVTGPKSGEIQPKLDKRLGNMREEGGTWIKIERRE